MKWKNQYQSTKYVEENNKMEFHNRSQEQEKIRLDEPYDFKQADNRLSVKDGGTAY